MIRKKINKLSKNSVIKNDRNVKTSNKENQKVSLLSERRHLNSGGKSTVKLSLRPQSMINGKIPIEYSIIHIFTLLIL